MSYRLARTIYYKNGDGDGTGTGGGGTLGGGDTDGSSDTGGADSAGGDWRGALPADLAAAPFFRSANSLEQALSDLGNAADAQGNSLRVPGPDASPEQLTTFYAKVAEKAPGLMRAPAADDDAAYLSALTSLGRPDDASKYEIPEIDGSPTMSDERRGEWKTLAHDAGLTNKQFDRLLGSLLKSDAQADAATQQTLEAGIGALKGEWGNAYDQRMGRIMAMAEKTGATPDMMEALTGNNINADTLKWFFSIADRISGPAEQQGTVGTQGKNNSQENVLTPADALAQVAEIEQQLYGPGRHALTPERSLYLSERRVKLMMAANPDSSTDSSGLRRSVHGS